MTNHHTKLEDPWAMSFLVIDQTRFVYRRMEGPTDWQVQAIYPFFFEGGHKNKVCFDLFTIICSL